MAAALVRGALLCGSIIVIQKLTRVLYKAFLMDKINKEASQSEREDQSATTTSTMMNLKEVGREFERRVIDEGNQIRERIKVLLERASHLRLNEAVPTPLQRLTAPFVGKESDVVGRDGDKEQIIELLLSGDASGKNLSVIPIVGLGGVGKTTLAQLVYKDSRVRKHFDLKVWVTVSEDFDVFRITKIILEKVTAKKCETRELFDLQSELSEALAGKKFLFVHDDVWNEKYELWDGLKSAFESGARGSKIIVTTRSKNIVLTMSMGVVHELKLVSDQDCWRIFEKHVFEDSAKAPAELQEIGRSFFQYSSQYKSTREEPTLIMHDIVHDLAMHISGEFSFEFNDSNDLSKLPTKACHLSLTSSKGSEVVEIMKGLTSQTRSLRTFLLLRSQTGWNSEWDSAERECLRKSLLPDLFLKVGGCLRVLSLSILVITKLPDSIGNIKYLSYLDLSCTSIKELPGSICTFYNLQTLLLSWCRVLERLPTSLADLVNLRHLDIRETRLKGMSKSSRDGHQCISFSKVHICI